MKVEEPDDCCKEVREDGKPGVRHDKARIDAEEGGVEDLADACDIDACVIRKWMEAVDEQDAWGKQGEGG